MMYVQSLYRSISYNLTLSFGFAFVRVTGTETSQLRLAGGSKLSGRLEILIRGQWGTVCDDGFSALDARVACVILGHR